MGVGPSAPVAAEQQYPVIAHWRGSRAIDAPGKLGANRHGRRGFFAFIVELALRFWECIHALLIVVFTSRGSLRARAQVHNSGYDRLRARPCGRVNNCSGPGRTAATAPSAAARYHTRCDTRPDALSDAFGCQFRDVGRLGHDQSRQQFPGAPRTAGELRFRQRASEKSGRRRGLGSHRRAGFSNVGGAPESRRRTARKAISPATGVKPGAALRGSADASRLASMSGFRLTKAIPPSTFRSRCSRRGSISPSSDLTPRSTRGRGHGRSRWFTVSDKSTRPATPVPASRAPVTALISTGR